MGTFFSLELKETSKKNSMEKETKRLLLINYLLIPFESISWYFFHHHESIWSLLKQSAEVCEQQNPIEMTRWWVDWMHLTLHVAMFFANEEDQRKLLQHCTRLLWWKITVHVWVCVRYIFQCTVYAIRYMLRLTHWNNPTNWLIRQEVNDYLLHIGWFCCTIHIKD